MAGKESNKMIPSPQTVHTDIRQMITDCLPLSPPSDVSSSSGQPRHASVAGPHHYLQLFRSQLVSKYCLDVCNTMVDMDKTVKNLQYAVGGIDGTNLNACLEHSKHTIQALYSTVADYLDNMGHGCGSAPRQLSITHVATTDPQHEQLPVPSGVLTTNSSHLLTTEQYLHAVSSVRLGQRLQSFTGIEAGDAVLQCRDLLDASGFIEMNPELGAMYACVARFNSLRPAEGSAVVSTSVRFWEQLLGNATTTGGNHSDQPRQHQQRCWERYVPGRPCTICMDCGEDRPLGERWLTLQCRHSMHVRCLEGWITQRFTCPLCRSCEESVRAH